SVVFYKFRSAKDFDKAVFDGLSISVFDLKREIMVNKKLGKGTDFDLAIFNAQSNEEYTDDAAMIPRNTSILVQRNPAKKSGRGNAQLYLGLSAQPSASSSAPGTTTLEGSSLSPANPAPAVSAVDLEGMTEDQKIEAMLATESQQWEEEMKQRPGPRPWNGGGFRRGGFGGEGGHHGGPGFLSNRPPPPDYVCHRCLKKGHYKNQCPTIGDPVFDRPRPKPTTGIPKSFLKAVPLDGAASDVDRLQAAASAGVMVTPDGELVVVQPNRAAWSKVSEKTSKAKFAFGDMYDSAPVLDPSFECPICHGNMKGAVTASCCGSKFCEECIREKLNENDDTCPKCKKSLTLDGLVPDDELRKNIEAKLLELFNQPTEKEKGGANQQKQQQQQ
ncbi:DWNN domain-containing protein, partial [Zopfochytrium polystomum]